MDMQCVGVSAAHNTVWTPGGKMFFYSFILLSLTEDYIDNKSKVFHNEVILKIKINNKVNAAS